MPAGGSGGGSGGGGGRAFHHHRTYNHKPRVNTGVPAAPMHPGMVLCCQSIGITVAALVVGAVCGAFGGGGHAIVLNIGEERVIPAPSVDATVADNCRGCAQISAWFDSPDLVPTQWDAEPYRWTRSMQLPTTLQHDRFQYWYFAVRNGSRVSATANFRGDTNGQLRLLVLDDAGGLTDGELKTSADALWKANRYHGHAMPPSDSVVVTQYPRAVVMVLVLNRANYGTIRTSVDVQVDYVFPRRDATAAATSVVGLWATDVPRAKGPADLPPRTKYVLARAPERHPAPPEDTVTVTVAEVEQESAAWWRTELRNALIACAACGIGYCYYRFQSRLPAFRDERAQWVERYGAAAAAAGTHAPEPLGAGPPAGNGNLAGGQPPPPGPGGYPPDAFGGPPPGAL